MPHASSLFAAAIVGTAFASPALSTPAASRPELCQAGTLYLTIDTGSMSQAENIAATLRKEGVRATFFLANEKTVRNDHSLDPAWADYWKSLVADGHAFGAHTWRHWYFRHDVGDKVAYISATGQRELLDAAGVCRELKRVDTAFVTLTGRALDALWRAPGGRTTPNTLRYARECGYGDAVGWSQAGFLGDELPSERYPNAMLLERALRTIRGGDILMMHTGIWSRKEAFAPVLGPLLSGLKARGFCFEALTGRH